MAPPPRIVVADDDALARRVITATLRDAGFEVVAEAIDGLQAVEAVEFHQPDLVLLDVVMPLVDGIDAARRIASRARDTVIVMLTGTHDETAALRGLHAGAVGHLSKDI